MYRRSMPSNSQPPTNRRGRSRQRERRAEERERRAEERERRAEERERRAEERERRWFVLNAIAGIIVAFGSGWLFWRLPPPPQPQPQLQGRDVRVSGGTRHDVGGGGTPLIARVDLGGLRSKATLTVKLG